VENSRLKLKIDLHVHTNHSDGNGSVKEVLMAAYKRGLNGIAITDHETTKGFFEAKDYAKKLKLIVIPGFELKTDAGHILALGVKWNPWGKRHAIYEEAVKWLRSEGGISIIAHPATKIHGINRWINGKPDAIEAINSNYPSKFMLRRGLKMALKVNVPMTAGSDAHQPESVGNAYTIIDAEGEGVEEILEAIRVGRVKITGRLSSIRSRISIAFKQILYRNGGMES
jgi:predicted metal-dependent phosphoesterase TrpH